MHQTIRTSVAYLTYAFDQMLAQADLLDGDLLNEPPTHQGTNSVGALILHCCAATEFWLGHVALG